MSNFSRLAWEQAMSTKKERVMVPVPDYEAEEVPMKIGTHCQVAFCGKGEDIAFYADFCLKIVAEADGELWDFAEIWMGEQKLSGDSFRMAAAFFELTRSDLIDEHVKEHLPDELAEAQFQAEELTR